MRGDLGITYDEDVLRLMDVFRGHGLRRRRRGHHPLRRASRSADAFTQAAWTSLGIKSYLHYPIAGYPYDIDRIVSDEGYGQATTTSRPRGPSWW